VKEKHSCSRRGFLKLAGAAGLSTLLGTTEASAISPEGRGLAAAELKVPTRVFGRSGRAVSILALGGMFDIAANQLMLRQALQWGVTYWDTADCYQNGSETGIGKYLAKYPQDRSRIFLVSKSDARDPEGLSRLLNRSLDRLQTDYLDLYFVHGIGRISELNEATRRWAANAKADGKIRLFGFSTHSNMADCLLGAAKLDWIDGIMMSYNFRNMDDPKMAAAVAACTAAGIGLTAMKTQGGYSWFSSGSKDLMQSFIDKGLSEEQAKLKAVWTNPRIASICSQMETMKILKANVAAAADPTSLSSADLQTLKTYAARTAHQYCAGCNQICEAATTAGLPIGQVMRYHMYCRSYGHADWARQHFQALLPQIRQAMASADYTEAERRCPNGLPIARLMREALETYL
jgi:predicted aldo/keto reductase-like oxidoreductase